MVSGAGDAALSLEAVRRVDFEDGIVRSFELHHHFLFLQRARLQKLSLTFSELLLFLFRDLGSAIGDLNFALLHHCNSNLVINNYNRK